MLKVLLLVVGAVIGIVASAVIDKPIVHTVETVSSDGIRRRVSVNVIVGIGNTINYNYKDES